MAVIQESKTIAPTTINKFLGLNLSNTGDTQIALGESGNMKNFYITDDFKLRKMFGYKSFNKFTYNIQGIYSTKISGRKCFLIVSGGRLNVYVNEIEKLNNNAEVNPNKTEVFTGDGETDLFIMNHTVLSKVNSLTIGKSTITEFTNAGINLLEFPSTTIEETTYPSGLIDIGSGRIYFGEVSGGTITTPEAPENGVRIAINFVDYLQASLIPLEGGDTMGDGEASFFDCR